MGGKIFKAALGSGRDGAGARYKPVSDSGAAMPNDCTYHVDQHIAEPYLESYRKKGFFAAGNTLILRSPEGEWVKVDPDDH